MGELFLVAFVAVAAFPGWLGVQGLWNGVVRVRGVSYSRSEEPHLYWLSVVTYLGVAAWLLYLFFHMLLSD